MTAPATPEEARAGLERVVRRHLDDPEWTSVVVADILHPDNRPVLLGAMGAGYELLNDFTRVVLAEAAKAAATLPEGWSIAVNASSHVSLSHGRHWVAIKGFGEPMVWAPYCGSLVHIDPGRPKTYPSLAEAVAAFALPEEPS